MDKKVCLVTFEYGNFSQNFEIECTNIRVCDELIKFICYLEDYEMIDYFRELVKNGVFTFDESFFIKELKDKTIIKEVEKPKNSKSEYYWSYVVDLDCEYMCYFDCKSGLIKYTAIPFEQLSDYPYSEEKMV